MRWLGLTHLKTGGPSVIRPCSDPRAHLVVLVAPVSRTLGALARGFSARVLVPHRITTQLAKIRNAESHDKAVFHCFFSDQQFHRPGPNLNCRLRTRCASSMPERVTAAVR